MNHFCCTNLQLDANRPSQLHQLELYPVNTSIFKIYSIDINLGRPDEFVPKIPRDFAMTTINLKVDLTLVSAMMLSMGLGEKKQK